MTWTADLFSNFHKIEILHSNFAQNTQYRIDLAPGTKRNMSFIVVFSFYCQYHDKNKQKALHHVISTIGSNNETTGNWNYEMLSGVDSVNM